MDKDSVKNKAVDKAKDLLGLNDTSIDAKLMLNGSAYEIENFNIQFRQSFDHKGEPQREVKGGIMSLNINNIVDKQINHWMFDQSIKFSGAVVFASFSRISNPVVIIQFSNARCFQYTKNINHPSISYTILISAEEIKVNGIDHTNNPELS